MVRLRSKITRVCGKGIIMDSADYRGGLQEYADMCNSIAGSLEHRLEEYIQGYAEKEIYREDIQIHYRKRLNRDIDYRDIH